MGDLGYTVTRQSQWPDGTNIVEISAGGLDYTNPDALVEKYPGEFKTFRDPRDAVETAVRIAKAWAIDGARGISIGYGATGGMTMPFEGSARATKSGVRGIMKLRAWAKAEYETLPKCDQCGELLPEKFFSLIDDDLGEYCTERCADTAVADRLAQMEAFTQ